MPNTREQELLAEQGELIVRMRSILSELADLYASVPEPLPEPAAEEPAPEPVAESESVITGLKIAADHNFVVVNDQDFIDKLTASGRPLLSKRATFATLDEAREFARFATERPLHIGELVREEASDAFYARLKYSYKSEIM